MPISQPDSKFECTELGKLDRAVDNSYKTLLENYQKASQKSKDFYKQCYELNVMLVPIKQLANTPAKLSRQKIMDMFSNAANFCKQLQSKSVEIIKEGERVHNDILSLILDFKKLSEKVKSTYEISEKVAGILAFYQDQIKSLEETDILDLKLTKEIKELSDQASRDYLAAGKIVKAKLSEIMAADARQADAKTSDIPSKSKSNLSTVITKDIPATTPATSSKSSAPVTDLFRAPLAPLGNKSVAQTVSAALAVRVG